MNINIGGQLFLSVQIPILWGTRAILQDKEKRTSVIDLSGDEAKLEILGNKPAPGIEYSLNIDGFTILRNGTELYKFNPIDTLLTSITLNIPDCQVTPWEIKIGSSSFSNNFVGGAGVGIFVSERGIGMGGPLPSNLARLIV